MLFELVKVPDWYEAFAFCAWDGGRLLTEVEWLYLALWSLGT